MLIWVVETVPLFNDRFDLLELRRVGVESAGLQEPVGDSQQEESLLDEVVLLLGQSSRCGHRTGL